MGSKKVELNAHLIFSVLFFIVIIFTFGFGVYFFTVSMYLPGYMFVGIGLRGLSSILKDEPIFYVFCNKLKFNNTKIRKIRKIRKYINAIGMAFIIIALTIWFDKFNEN